MSPDSAHCEQFIRAYNRKWLQNRDSSISRHHCTHFDESMVRHLVGRSGTCYVTPGTSMKRLARRREVYDQ